MKTIDGNEIILTEASGGESRGNKNTSGNSPSNSNSRGWACHNDIKNGAVSGGIAGGIGGAYLGGPGGATLGATVGAFGGAVGAGASSGNCRVICTHFMRKGLLEAELWRADMEFTRQQLPASMIRGYHLWAIPYVRLMRRSPLAEKIMHPLAQWRAEEVAYRMGVREKGNWKGKLLRWIGEPACLLIGQFVPEQNWEALWHENTSAV